MSIAAFLKSFLNSSLGKELEGFALDELLALIKKLYPNDELLINIISKIEDEIKKIQNIQP